MADPAEIALRVLEIQVKTLNKAANFIVNAAKHFIKKMKFVTEAFRFLVSKIRQIQAFIPSRIMKAIKDAHKFLSSFVNFYVKTLKDIVKWVTKIVKTVKAELTKMIVRMLKTIVQILKRAVVFLIATLRRLFTWLRSFLRTLPLLAQAIPAIRMVLSNIADIVNRLFQLIPLQSIAKMIEKKLVKVLHNVENIAAHLARDITRTISDTR